MFFIEDIPQTPKDNQVPHTPETNSPYTLTFPPFPNNHLTSIISMLEAKLLTQLNTGTHNLTTTSLVYTSPTIFITLER